VHLFKNMDVKVMVDYYFITKFSTAIFNYQFVDYQQCIHVRNEGLV